MSADGRRVALVTGAGSGIGREVARGLHARGFALALVGRTRSKLDETVTMIAALDACVIDCDIAARDQAQRCIDATVRRFGRIDVLVNNAGIAPLVPIATTDDATVEACFRVNTFAPAALIVGAWPVFTAQRSGCVVNVSTIGTLDPFPGFFAYAASKSALDSFTRSIAIEGKAIGVTAYSVNPGAVETPLLRSLFDERAISRATTLTPEGVAQVVVACACGERAHENGNVIVMPNA